MNISVIIVSYNSERFLKNCISSLIENTSKVDYEIIVIDNASADDSAKVVKKNFPGVRLVENKENKGFAKAVNQGIGLSDSDYVFLLNPDTVNTNNVLSMFYEYMELNKNVACCGGALFDEQMNPVISYGFFPSIKQVFFEEFGLRKIFKKYYYKKLSPGCTLEKEQKSVLYVDYISGADLFIRRDVFDKIGTFDEDFFMYFEETEFSFRLKKNNMNVALIPYAKIIHFEGKSLAKISFEKFRIFKKSEFLYFRKCRGKFIYLLAKILYLKGSLLKLIFKFDFEQFTKIKIIFKS